MDFLKEGNKTIIMIPSILQDQLNFWANLFHIALYNSASGSGLKWIELELELELEYIILAKCD